MGKKKKTQVVKFTWADMKRIVNRIPDNILKEQIIIWPDDNDEKGYKISCIEVLKEEYVHDGDAAACPKSIMKNSISKDEWDEGVKDGDYYTIFPKGMRIIIAE